MSPYEIRNEALYHDRTVQDWHRLSFPRSYWAIDIDLMGACGQPRCSMPLYLIESTTNPNKPIGILSKAGNMMNIPAFIVRHDASQIVEAHQISDGNSERLNESALHRNLEVVRQNHYLTHHPFVPFDRLR